MQWSEAVKKGGSCSSNRQPVSANNWDRFALPRIVATCPWKKFCAALIPCPV
jgi:hypothetical protein